MQYNDSAEFLRGIVKRGRKYYLGVTTITQDVDDFLATPYGKEIVTNSSIQILLKQHSAAIDQIGEVFYLSEGEKQLLLSADKGEGIFFAGKNHVAIRVIASEDEHKIITSNPEEIMKMKAQAKLIKDKPIVPPGPSYEVPKPAQPIVITQPTVSPIQTIVPPLEKPEQKPEEALSRRIAEMEESEKVKVDEHKKLVATEAEQKAKEEEEKKKSQNTLGGFGGLPKYQDLFVNKGTLPPLPPLPKFEPPKAEVVPEKPPVVQKPVFVNMTKEEAKIPQPSQLTKKPTSLIEEKPATPAADVKTDDKKPTMDYDKLFGNGIV
ncbi:MAG: hypothetical protein WCI04_07440 [archaeon]